MALSRKGGSSSFSRVGEYLATREDLMCPKARRELRRQRNDERRRGLRSASAPKVGALPPVTSAAAPTRRSSFLILEASCSPRLANVADDVKCRAAPLIPEPAEKPAERFCTQMPRTDLLGAQARSANGIVDSELSFADWVTRFENSMGQATVLLNNRLMSVQRKVRPADLSYSQNAEICQIADGIAAAVYHMKKWAYCLQIPGHSLKPTKPAPCEDAEECLAIMRCASTWLLVISASLSKKVSNALKIHGSEGAEKFLQQKGVKTDRLRTLVPHLEDCLLRLGRFTDSTFAPKEIEIGAAHKFFSTGPALTV